MAVNVKIGADYRWENVEPELRMALLQRFSFDQMELGNTVFLSEAIATVQAHKAVEYCDFDVFDKINESQALTSFDQKTAPQLKVKDRISASLAEVKQNLFEPASIVYLTPNVSDTLILKEIRL